MAIYLLKDPFLSLYIKKDFNLNLELENAEQLQKLKKDYEEILTFQNQTQETNISKIIINDPLTITNEITILKGKEENISKGDVVLNEKGLIGIVSKTNKHTSVVQTIKHKDTKIAVKIGPYNGLLESENGQIIIKNWPSNNNVNINDEITTSNYSYFFKDIKIGTIKEIIPNDEITNTIIITSYADFENLNYVYIKGSNNNE